MLNIKYLKYFPNLQSNKKLFINQKKESFSQIATVARLVGIEFGLIVASPCSAAILQYLLF